MKNLLESLLDDDEQVLSKYDKVRYLEQIFGKNSMDTKYDNRYIFGDPRYGTYTINKDSSVDQFIDDRTVLSFHGSGKIIIKDMSIFKKLFYQPDLHTWTDFNNYTLVIDDSSYEIDNRFTIKCKSLIIKSCKSVYFPNGIPNVKNIVVYDSNKILLPSGFQHLLSFEYGEKEHSFIIKHK